MNDHRALKPEDYQEPRCLLCDEPYGSKKVRPVPQQRIAEKLDEYMSRRDYAGAEKHLLYWMQEALEGGDERGRLMLCNELIGHYRKTGQRAEAFARAEEALGLLGRLELEGSISEGTTCVNAATAYSAFGEDTRALELFSRAAKVYEGRSDTDPAMLGGLYNNMALALGGLGRFGEAFALFDKAMALMGRVEGGELEQAITCLNIADTLEAEQGAEAAGARIRSLLDQAYAFLRDAPVPRDGYYAFVCEKCAPGFGHHGDPRAEAELMKAAEEIYDRA